MTRTLTIISLLPHLLNTNGDAENARVLAQRARWSGHDASVVTVTNRADLPDVVDAIVIGSGSDAALTEARDVLLTMVDKLREWTTAGVPLLAVGTGWELLSWGIELTDGKVIEGLGLVAGRAVPRLTRATDDLVVTSKHGRLVGFENHARDYVGAEASPLGRVAYGAGNGNGGEGLVMGDVVGTHLHGPVLARNPRLADHLLTAALRRAGVDYAPGERTISVDAVAEAARDRVAAGLSLPSA
ncbi:cobyric acid synthase [Cryobacterium sp. CG_9.6]|uniref:type 1 glutamine amidotransferase n=1 Tax=Cryobacterium sp. CG_9.6 TaxID=2760710 RepID=UPI002473E530|nr:cobyric acid synthase [Cryobacterium sp. CG_9.6]MDH6237025.1 CobQ-like glutamine amidotransferase family enzyme [Cryobacterium sp. CG_9.6]